MILTFADYTRRYDIGLTSVLRFSGVMSRMKRCENAHVISGSTVHIVYLLDIENADPGVASSILTRSHTFVEIDHEMNSQ